MAVNLKPAGYNLPTMVEGDTLPATNFLFTGTEADLASVGLEVRASGSTTASLNLSSGSGITIQVATAGAWSVDIDRIEELTLMGGIYSFDMDFVDVNGDRRTYVAGCWHIITEHAD